MTPEEQQAAYKAGFIDGYKNAVREVAEERERCAKIVESYEGDDWPHAAAAAIRSR